MKKHIGILLFLPLAIVLGYYAFVHIQFNRNCGGHLKRAGDANTVALAMQELQIAIDYLDANKITEGYTSVVYRTPDEDVGFWYTNLKASLGELKAVSPGASQYERSNVLMKLRETLLDSGASGVEITMPSGISVFPHNRAAMWWCIFGIGLAIGGFVTLKSAYDDSCSY